MTYFANASLRSGAAFATTCDGSGDAFLFLYAAQSPRCTASFIRLRPRAIFLSKACRYLKEAPGEWHFE